MPQHTLHVYYRTFVFTRHKVEYVERMRAVSEEGAWDGWLGFFLEGLRSQAETSYSRTHQLRELQERYEEEYPGSTTTDRFARQLLQYPYFTAPALVEYLDVSRRTAYLNQGESPALHSSCRTSELPSKLDRLDVILTLSFE